MTSRQSASPPAAGVTEGSSASFTVSASPVPAAPLDVTLTVGQSGDFAASGETGSRTVTVPVTGSLTFEVATVDDGADEPPDARGGAAPAEAASTAGERRRHCDPGAAGRGRCGAGRAVDRRTAKRRSPCRCRERQEDAPARAGEAAAGAPEDRDGGPKEGRAPGSGPGVAI